MQEPLTSAVTMLLVEDDAVLQELYSESFREAGFTVLQATDGEMAIEMVDAQPEISVVLLDLMLPKISGYDVLTHIRQARGHKFPVLIVSALADISDQARALQLGATEYITKGDVPPSHVIDLLKKYAALASKSSQLID